MDIDTMLAGREMDRLIAERIFLRDPMNARHGLHENGDLEYYWGYPQGHDIAGYYSTSVGFAWQVVDMMLEYAYPFELKWRGPKGDDSWLASFGVPAYSRIPSEAIYRAALLMKGAGDSE